MTRYELMFIVRPDVEGEEAVDQQIERYGRMIVDNGSEVTGVDKWGRRRFAYEVQGFTEGYYVVIQFKSTDAVVNELNRILKIADEILRHIVVRLDEPKSAPVSEEQPATEAAEQAESSADETASEPVGQADESQPATT